MSGILFFIFASCEPLKWFSSLKFGKAPQVWPFDLISSQRQFEQKASALFEKLSQEKVFVETCFEQECNHWGGKGGQSAIPDSEKFAKNREKEGKNHENSGKKRKNLEEKAKIRKVLSLCPS